MDVQTKLHYKTLRPYVHIAAWLCYIGFVFMPSFVHKSAFLRTLMPFYFSVLVVSFYANSTLLIPRYFKQQRYSVYFIASGILLVIGILLLSFILFAINEFGSYKFYPQPFLYAKVCFSYLVESSVLILIKIAKEWYIQAKRLRDVEFQKINYELQLLKKQLDPHFIFNTLNNIYMLVIDRSERAPGALLRLSELFDYILHDSMADKVELGKDLAFTENYIALQKMRLREEQAVRYEVSGSVAGYIAPLSCINFIENAFKHAHGNVSVNGQDYHVYIDITTNGHNLHCVVKNGMAGGNVPQAGTGGIGILNAIKRLSMIYGTQYDLDIQTTGTSYSVSLKIPLDDKLRDR